MNTSADFPPAPQWFDGIFRLGDIWIGNPPYRPDTRRRQHKPSIAKQIKQAEKSGKPVTSITTPDGVTLHFGKSESSEANNDSNEWDRELLHGKPKAQTR
jgi:hypothetical protein